MLPPTSYRFQILVAYTRPLIFAISNSFDRCHLHCVMSDKKGFRRVGNFVKKVARAAKDVDAFIIGADELGLLSKEDFVTKQKPQGSRRSKAPEYSSADQYENITAEEATRINNSLWLKSMPQWNDDCRFEAFRPKKFLGEGAYGIIGVKIAPVSLKHMTRH